MSREVTSVKFPSFPNYTDEMYLGDEPARPGGGMTWVDPEALERGEVITLRSDAWSTQHGSAETLNGKLMCCDMKAGFNDSVEIIGEHLMVHHIKMHPNGNYAIAVVYTNDGYMSVPEQWPDPLEKKAAVRIIKKVGKEGKIGKLIEETALRLMEEAESNG